VSEGHGVIEVHGLAFRLGAVGVNQHNFGSQSAEQQRVGKGCADISHADHGDTHGARTFFHLEFPRMSAVREAAG
jgi:hypothetical protein